MVLLRKVIRKLKAGAWYPFYNGFYERLKLNSDVILLESRGGNALEGNILRLLEELSRRPYCRFRCYLSVKKEEKKEVKQKLSHYGILQTCFLNTGSIRYYYCLARAKYLVNDTSFPGRFVKKEGQIYLNTWHGTPLKKMGADYADEKYSMGNVMRNLLQSDYLVFPNRYMEEKMTDAYQLSNLFQGIILREGYPRNSIFYSEKAREVLRKELAYGDKQVIVYMPTFRGSVGCMENTKRETEQILTRLDKELTEQQILYVKLHPLSREGIAMEGFSHILEAPRYYDINDFLNASDVLITDYSSVMYDYANTNNPIILFTEDEERYKEDRGVYEQIENYPFFHAKTIKELIEVLQNLESIPRDSFRKRYCTYDGIGAVERICRQVFLGEKSCQEYQFQGDGKENILIYAGDLDKNGITTALLSMLSGLDLNRFHYYISFRISSLKNDPRRLDILPSDCGLLPLASEMNMDLWTMAAQALYLRKGIESPWIRRRLEKSYRREWKKHFGSMKFRHVVHYNGYERYVIALLQRFNGMRTIWVHNDMRQEIQAKGNQNPYLLREAYREYDHVVVVSPDIFESTLSISKRADNITIIGNIHDYQSVLERADKVLEFDQETESTVSEDKLSEVLNGPKVKFINIGRYSPEKGHERLIRAFERYWENHRDTYLIIIGGTGNLYHQTVNQAAESKAREYIILIKAMKNPMPVLKKCQLFLLSSLYEGLGLVMLEADTLGIPVAVCHVTGPAGFIIEHGGTLVEDSEEGLYQGMLQFSEHKVPVMQVDYERLNDQNIQKCEQLW